MRVVFLFVLVFSVSVCDAELKLEATDGDNVTISFKTAELERADRVRITFKGENGKKLVAQYCRCADCGYCRVVETPGVLLRIEEGTVSLILLDVSSSNSGLYEAQVLNGNYVSEIQATLVVKEPVLSSTKESPQTSSPKPPDSSEHLWLLLCASLVPLVIIGVIGFLLFKKLRREREALPDDEEDKETSVYPSTSSSKNNKCKRNDSECAAVPFKTFREETEDLRFSNTSDVSLPPELNQKTDFVWK